MTLYTANEFANLAALYAKVSTGDSVYFPAGTYTGPVDFSAKEGITLFGDGEDTVITSATTTAVILGYKSGIKNLKVSYTGSTVGQSAVQFKDVDALGLSGESFVENCWIASTKIGIQCDQAYCSFHNVSFAVSGVNESILVNASNCTVRGCRFNGTLGIFTASSASETTVDNNLIIVTASGAQAITTEEPDSLTIINNRMYTLDTYCLDLALLNTRAYTVVTGNVFRVLGGSAPAVRIQYSADIEDVIFCNNIVDCKLTTGPAMDFTSGGGDNIRWVVNNNVFYGGNYPAGYAVEGDLNSASTFVGNACFRNAASLGAYNVVNTGGAEISANAAN